MNFVPVFSPRLPTFAELKKYLEKIDSSRIYSNFGPLTMAFEERAAEYFGVGKELVATSSNATIALEGALATVESPKHNPIYLPAWTFTATAAAVSRSGRPGVFCDVDDNGRLEDTGSESLRLETLPFGADLPTNMEAALTPIILDAAASFDALKNVGSSFPRPVLMVISLHATKCLPAGEGAVVLSNDSDWIQRFRQWSNFGMWGTRISNTGGTNAKMSEYVAAVAHSSLDVWPSAREDWVSNAAKAQQLSSECQLNVHYGMRSGFATPYWIVECSSHLQREQLRQLLNGVGIDNRLWWESGCHSMPAYRDFKAKRLERTNYLAMTSLGLPFHRNLDVADWGRIQFAMQQFKELEN